MTKQTTSKINSQWVIYWCSVIAFVGTVTGLTIWFGVLKSQTIRLSAEVDERIQVVEDLMLLQAEVDKLSTAVLRQQGSNAIKRDRIKRAIQSTRTSADFPVRGGPFIVLKQVERENGEDLFFYVPAGNHKLRITAQIVDAVSSGSNRTSYNRIGKPFEKEIKVRQQSMGTLKFRLEDIGDSSVVTFKLLDADGEQFEVGSLKLSKRTLTGKLGSEGRSIALAQPSSINPYIQEYLNMEIIKSGTRCLFIRFEIDSPDASISQQAKDVQNSIRYSMDKRIRDEQRKASGRK